MKHYRKVIVTIVLLVVLGCGYAFYQPLQENHIYQKDLKLNELTDDEGNTSDEEKIINRAKDTIESITSKPLQEEDYLIRVNYQVLMNAKMDVARVDFIDKTTYEYLYSVAYATSSGELMEYYSTYEFHQGNTTMARKDLDKIAKDFFFSNFSTDEEEIQYSGQYEGDFYISHIIFNKNYKRYTMYIDAYTGIIKNFQAYEYYAEPDNM